MAQKIRGWQVTELPDLVQSANFGLDKAIRRFDVEKGFKFSTYAMWWIRQTTQREIKQHSRLIRIPADISQDSGDLVITINTLQQTLKREPTLEEIVEASFMTIKQFQEVQHFGSYNHRSLDELVGDGDSNTSLGDLVARVDSREVEVDDRLSDGAELELENLLSALAELEKVIFSLRHGVKLRSLSGRTSFGLDKEIDYDGLFDDFTRKHGMSLNNIHKATGLGVRGTRDLSATSMDRIRQLNSIEVPDEPED